MIFKRGILPKKRKRSSSFNPNLFLVQQRLVILIWEPERKWENYHKSISMTGTFFFRLLNLYSQLSIHHKEPAITRYCHPWLYATLASLLQLQRYFLPMFVENICKETWPWRANTCKHEDKLEAAIYRRKQQGFLSLSFAISILPQWMKRVSLEWDLLYLAHQF